MIEFYKYLDAVGCATPYIYEKTLWRGGTGGTPPPPGNHKNYCRKVVLYIKVYTSRGIYFRKKRQK